MATCTGDGDDHCCYLGDHGVCRHLEEHTVPGRRWACGLYRQFGSWDAVHASDTYGREVRPKLRDSGVMVDCGGWPQQVGALKARVERGDCNPSAACCWGEPWQT